MLAGLEGQVNKHLSHAVALMLWDLQAINVSVEQPYKLVSGDFSPIYINCRRLISNPTFMNLFTACARLICEGGNIKVDVIAGGETAGIPFAAFLAQALSLPMVYVRKERKEHGLSSLVEGHLQPNERVLLVEDLITDGESKLHFIDAVKACTAKIEHVLVLFDREQGGAEVLASQGITLHSATTMTTTIEIAESAQILSEKDLASVRRYLHSPKEWSAENGVAFN